MLRTLTKLLLLIVVGSNEPGLESRALARDSVIIEDVTVIDGTGGPSQPHSTVRIRDGRIARIEPFVRGDKSDANVRRVDGSGQFLIPGLWDTHLHLVDIGEEAIPILPYYGITSVRDMGGDIPRIKQWRAQIERGELIGPRITFCGPMLEGDWDPTSVGGRTDHWVVRNPEEARSTVSRLKKEGVDCIKMRGYKTPETYFALAAAAKSVGLPLVGHPPYALDPIEVSNAGQQTLDHAFYPWPWTDLAPEKRKAIEDTFHKNGTAVVPTLIAWEAFRLTWEQFAVYVDDIEGRSDPRLKFVSAALRKNWRFGIEDRKSMNAGSPGWLRTLGQHFQLVADMHANGVSMMTGTDTGAPYVFPGSSIHEELKLLVAKARFTPLEALRSATSVPAKLFGLDAQLGTIERGKIADLVLLSADPLADIGNTEKIAAVMAQGRWLDRKALDTIGERVAERIRRTHLRPTTGDTKQQ